MIEAVKTLGDNALQLLEFINTTLLANYDSYVGTGEKYEETAKIINEMLDGVSEQTVNLNIIMDEMWNSVASISESVQEAAKPSANQKKIHRMLLMRFPESTTISFYMSFLKISQKITTIERRLHLSTQKGFNPQFIFKKRKSNDEINERRL